MDELSKYITRKLNDDIYIVSTAKDTLYTYLIIGRDKAAIIDTGFGFGAFYEEVRKLTEKPIIVVNTHGHLDHVGANAVFDSIYIHEKMLFDFPKNVKEEMINNNVSINYIKERETICLGNKTLVAYELTSHSNLDICYLLEEDKILFTGDTVDPGQVLLIAPIESPKSIQERFKDHLNAMIKLKDLSDKFDFICPGHNETPINKDIIDSFIELDLKYLNNELTDLPIDHFYIEQSEDCNSLARIRHGNASIIYRKSDGDGLYKKSL